MITAVGTKPMILIIPNLKEMRQNPVTIVVIVACIIVVIVARYSPFGAIAVSIMDTLSICSVNF